MNNHWRTPREPAETRDAHLPGYLVALFFLIIVSALIWLLWVAAP